MDAHLVNLIERLEKAIGPDRELDWRIAEKFDIPERWPTSALWPPFMPKSKYDKSIPAYSASIDAAVALVERVLPGWTWTLDSGSSTATLWEQDSAPEHLHQVRGATPSLALCLAILRAKEDRDDR